MFLRRAISDGRGGEPIRKINALYRNVRATMEGSDDDVIGDLSERLTDGKTRVTIQELQTAALASGSTSKYLRAFNMEQCLLGKEHRLSDGHLVPAPPGMQ
jgi:hypothetical protein